MKKDSYELGLPNPLKVYTTMLYLSVYEEVMAIAVVGAREKAQGKCQEQQVPNSAQAFTISDLTSPHISSLWRSSSSDFIPCLLPDGDVPGPQLSQRMLLSSEMGNGCKAREREENIERE